jgi:hypothetical protein
MSGYKNVSDHLEFDRISSGEIEYLESDAVFITENVYLHDLHLNPLGHERFAALLAPTAVKYLRDRRP